MKLPFGREERAMALRAPDHIQELANDIPKIVQIAMLTALAHDSADVKVPEVDDLVNRIFRACFGMRCGIEAAIARLEQAELASTNREKRIQQVRQRAVDEVIESGLEANFDPHGFFVYLLWGDATDAPIYVGQSTNVLSRLGTHLGNRDKRRLTRRVQLLRCTNKNVMDRTEGFLIRKFQPIFNIQGVGAQ